MRAVGVDVASSGYAAIALAVDGVPKLGALWQPEKNDTGPVRLVSFSRFIDAKLGLWKPDMASVEELAVFLNKKVIRALSKMEGVALLQCKKRSGVLVVNPPVTQARSIVFKGEGVRSKEDAWQAFKRKFPDFRLPAATAGGMDIADAMVHALAAPVILERRK